MPTPDLPEKLDLGTVLAIVRDEFREHENLRPPTARALVRAATDAYHELATRPQPQLALLSAADLDALPDGTVILDADGDAAVKAPGSSWYYAELALTSGEVVPSGPLQILYRPTAEIAEEATE